MITLGIIVAGIVFLGIGVLFGAPYVPSHHKEIRMLFDEFLPLKSSDTLLDIGSGDGVVLREVSRRGARAIGYEVHPLFVLLSRIMSRTDERVSIRWANAWTTPFPDEVTIVYAFTVSRGNHRLADKVQDEATRLQREITLVCYGNPLKGYDAKQTFRAYAIYRFKPLHLTQA